MPSSIPCLSLAVTPLQASGSAHFAIHVINAPYPKGYVLRDCIWTNQLSSLWQSWQEMFSPRQLPPYPSDSTQFAQIPELGQPVSVRLMQSLGLQLWQWLFDGPILEAFSKSQGIAIGQRQPLRLRLEIRDPDLIALPWEIMQDGLGKQAISLSQQLLLSRTTIDVHSLPILRVDYALKILLVLGEATEPGSCSDGDPSVPRLELEQEATILADTLRLAGSATSGFATSSPCQVDTLIQPTPAELIQQLERQTYNVFFYAGHGVPAPDGGLLFLRPNQALNGTELAQVLTRCQVKLAVFNACWGAQPDQEEQLIEVEGVPVSKVSRSIPRSSLAEVLIHHGVPAVLGMRDSIADQEALDFIRAFARALADRAPIDRAVAIARQHLLTMYRFNCQAWTLPVLYMHPEFEGELLTQDSSATEFPASETRIPSGPLRSSTACLRALSTEKVWQIHDGIMRVGRDKQNELVLPENEGGVSRKHARIFCRHLGQGSNTEVSYFLEDFSRYGTWVLGAGGWQKVHRQEIPLSPGMQLKFGSSHNEAMEFVIQPPPSQSTG